MSLPEKKKIYLLNWNSRRKKKKLTHEPIYSSVYFSPQENSDILIWVNKGLRTNIYFCYDIISQLANNMMGIEKTAACTDI